MYRKPVRDATGKFKAFEIDSRGNVYCTLDPEYEIRYREFGKKKKYRQVQLMRAGNLRWLFVHRLMAFSWLGKPKSKLLRIVDHIDGDSFNNNVCNLRWATATGNNINRACKGCVASNGLYIPKILGYEHIKYATPDYSVCQDIRRSLVECYIRFNCRFPEKSGDAFPHSSIYKY